MLYSRRRLPPLETLTGFEAVARHGSFTTAARELHLTQGAVSKQVRALEEALGLVLFDRHARGVSLTVAGRQLHEEVAPLLQQLAGSLARVRDHHAGQTLSVVATHAVSHYWLFSRVLAFNREHPEITVGIHSTNAIEEAVVHEHDFGILYGDGEWRSLVAAPLFAERVFPVCASRLALTEPATPGDLVELPLIRLDSRAWDCMGWEEWFGHVGVDYRPDEAAPCFNQVTLALDAALQGMGVALGWEFMVREYLEAGRLRPVGPFVHVTGRADYLVHGRHQMSPAAATFRDWLLAHEAATCSKGST